MRLLASAVAVFAVALIVLALWFAAPAVAAGDVVAEPSTLDQIKEGLAGIALLVITVVAAFLARHLPGLLEAARLWLVEWAMSERVQRIDSALDTALDAGDDPETAARAVRAKLPQTVKRSGKSEFDLEDEAATRLRARRNADRQHSDAPAAK